MKRDHFLSIVDNYDAILFDSYGVLKNYNGILDGAQETLKVIRSQQKRYRVLTNDASSSQEKLSKSFARGGITIRPHRIITSGMMAQSFLESKEINGMVLYLGTDSSSDYIVMAHKEKISINDYRADMIDEIGCIVFLDDEGYDWNTTINKVVNLLRKRTVPVIVANSDMIYPVAKNDVSIATGSIARLVENILGYRFIHFGKPDIQMFLYAFNDLKENNPDLEKSRILMVGDTLHTDILGATKFGIDSALVLSGNTTEANCEWSVKATGIVPDYICQSIV